MKTSHIAKKNSDFRHRSPESLYIISQQWLNIIIKCCRSYEKWLKK